MNEHVTQGTRVTCEAKEFQSRVGSQRRTEHRARCLGGSTSPMNEHVVLGTCITC